MHPRIRRAMQCAAALAGLAVASFAQAVPQMLLPAPASAAKAARGAPADIRSGAVPVRFNARELHALNLGDEVELGLPNGTRHAFVFDQKKDHGGGIVSWVGYYRDADQKRMLRAIVTTGPDGSIGTIQTPAGEFAIRKGAGDTDWLVDLKAETPLHPKLDLGHDTMRVPLDKVPPAEPLAMADFAETVPGMNVPLTSTIPMTTKVLTTPSLVTVDMLMVYNDSLAAGVGNVDTFFANLITEANTAYADSRVGIQLRLAGKMLVHYSDSIDNGTTLNDFTNNAGAFAGVETQRNAVGADMVSFYRGGDNATIGGANFGAGVAWSPSSPIGSGWAPYMYSTVTGCYGGCEFIWIHEVGHNMGNLHDRATDAWESTVDHTAPGQGSYPYSYGFYSCNGQYDNSVLTCNAFGGGCTNPDFTSGKPNCKSTTNAFRDLMAYFHESTTLVRRFSNPDLDCPGSSPNLKCGLADGSMDVGGRQDSADTALSMNNNRVALSALRSPPGGASSSAVALAASANPARVGTPITFTATITASGASPTGFVSFTANGNTFTGCGAVAVSAGTASCTAAIAAAGTFSIAAQFTGTNGFGSSTSPVLTQNVAPIPAMVGTSPRKADFNADLKSDLAWKGPAGAAGLWLMNGTTFGTAASITGPAGAAIRALADFDGDGKTDILWRGADGTYSISLMNGATISSTTVILAGGSGWEVIGVGDFDANGRADLLWNAANGQFGVWLMSGATRLSNAVLTGPAGAAPSLLGDFDGDGRTDILWVAGDGSVTISLMSGLAATSSATVLGPTTVWRPTLLADLNGDGKMDIVWSASDGSVGAWLMNGTAYLGTNGFLGAGTGWSVVFAGDLNGDGRHDLLFRHANGTYMAWLMNGLGPLDTRGIFSTPNSGWSLAAVGDFNGDGKADLMWRYVDGTHGLWLMNGLDTTYYGTVLNGGGGWELAP